VVASVAAAAVLLVYVLPRAVGTTLSAIASSFSTVSFTDLAVMTVLWGAGLFVHSFVLTGALPGLTRRRALTLNLTGSAVANVLPFGGAAGMALNYVMIRSWAVSAAGFASYTFVTNLCVVIVKLTIPSVALVALLVAGAGLNSHWGALAAVSAAALGALVVVGVVGFSTPRWSDRFVDWLARIVTWAGRVVGRQPDREHLVAWLRECRAQVGDVLRHHGRELSGGMAGYAILQAVLLGASAHAFGVSMSPAQILAVFAVDRVLTLAVLTPGGLGFAETGTAAALVAFGAPAAAAAAAVLLYRGFTYALEIPVGGTWLTGWLLARRLRPTAAR